MKRLSRNKYFIVFSIIMPFVFYAVYTTTNNAEMGISGTKWKGYFLVSMTCFSLMSSSVSTLGIQMIYDKKQPWMNWLFTQPLQRWKYFAARIMTQMVLNLLVILFMFVIAAQWKNIELPMTTWMGIVLWIWLAILPFLALGTWVSVVENTESAAAVANFSTLGLALLGGLWMPLQEMPALVQIIGPWLPSNLYAEGAWSLLAGDAIKWSTSAVLSLYFLLFLTGSVMTHHHFKKTTYLSDT